MAEADAHAGTEATTSFDDAPPAIADGGIGEAANAEADPPSENSTAGCDDDRDSSEEDESSGSSETDSDSSAAEEDDGSDEPNDGLSQYERLRIERIARNNARLAKLGFAETAGKETTKKTRMPSKPRRSSAEGPRRQLPGRAGRATFNESSLSSPARKEKNPDACYVCQKEEGELRCCDYCRKLYHPECHTPPILPGDDAFKCASCEAAGKKYRKPCGICEGCSRSYNCMTCVMCVKQTGKCIFRKCRSRGKTKPLSAEGNNDHETEANEEEDRNETECHVCKDGGDLICCSSCPKVFHSNCHKPKIHHVPEGEWNCMYCVKQKALSLKEEKRKRALSLKEKRKRSGSLIADLGPRKVICTVRFPAIECTACGENGAPGRLQPLDMVSCRACGDFFHLECLDPPLQTRPSKKWRCPTCQAAKAKAKKETKKGKVKKEKEEDKPLFEGEHDDDCFICGYGGDLLCCDYCAKAFHLKCHMPPLDRIPDGIWKCQECAALGYTRKFKCGECEACLREDCGKCNFCLDKPKFGGNNILRQKCELKLCPYMRLAPPAKKATSLTKKEKDELKLQFKEGSVSTKKKKVNGDEKNETPIQLKPVEGPPSTKKRNTKSHTSESAQTTDEEELTSSLTIKAPGDDLQKKSDCSDKRQKIGLSQYSSVIDNYSSDSGQPKGHEIIAESYTKEHPEIRDQQEIDENEMRLVIAQALEHTDSPEFSERACQLLASLSENAGNAAFLFGGLNIILKAMKENHQKAIFHSEAIGLLVQLMSQAGQHCIIPIIKTGFVELILNSMQYHSTDLKMQQTSCSFFRAISYDFANHPNFNSVDGAKAIINSMNNFQNEYSLLAEGCYFLQNMLCNHGVTHQLLTSVIQAIPFIIDAMMSAQSEHADFLQAACGVLANLATKEIVKANSDGCDLFVKSLLGALDTSINPDVGFFSLCVLRLIMLDNEENKAKFVNFGGIKTVANYLTAPHSSALSGAGMKLLSELTKTNKNYARLLIDEGVFDFVTSEMRKHQQSPNIQTVCCKVLRNLAEGSKTDGGKADGTVNLILAAMKTHIGDKMVQFEASHVLIQYCSQFPRIAELMQLKAGFLLSKQTNIECHRASQFPKNRYLDLINESNESDQGKNSDFCSKPSNYDPIWDKIRLVIDKALKNLENPKLQKYACKVLQFMATSANNVSMLISLGCLRMVSKVMKKHPQISLVQAECAALLAELSWISPSCVALIAEEGCLQLALSSMQCHSTNLKVQQMTCSFFRAMSYDFHNHRAIASVDGVRAVVDSMKRNTKKYDVLKEACYFFQNIMCNPDTKSKTTECVLSTVPIIIDALGDKLRDVEYTRAACGVLANLAIDENAREQMIRYNLLVPTLLSILASSKIDMDACKCSLNVLNFLATVNNKAKAKIANHGGMKTIIGFLTPLDSVILLDSGMRLLAELTKTNKRNSQLFLDEGGFELVTTKMMNNAHWSILQVQAFATVRNLAVLDLEEVKVAVSLILEVIRDHKEDRIQLDACQALLQYCCRFPSAAKMLQSEEANQILASSQFKYLS